ncbi:hypothetical protein [Aureibaculum luteum]|uniref:hypothetical protein n=1 Tax=Aureibaculum luteum TaxID=1548456 RepID=UPI000E46BA27|nr:hypothetical protein [Aureibaculum luteum]
MNCVEIEPGKEAEYFSVEIIQKFILDFHNDIEQQTERKKFYKGAGAYKAIYNLYGSKVDVWIEWNARRVEDALDIGITKFIFYDIDTIPDLVLDRWNIMSKELKRTN